MEGTALLGRLKWQVGNVVEPVGAEVVFLDAPAMVLRCVRCNCVLICVASGSGRYWIEMRGVSCLQIEA